MRKRYVEGKRIGLHTSPTWIMSAEMRGEQGPGLLQVRDRGTKGVVTDKKEYTKVMMDLSLSPAVFFFLNKNSCLNFLWVHFMFRASLWTYLLWWGTPAIHPSNNPACLPLFLGTDTHRTAYMTLTRVGGLCLACHKYFVNLNPIHTFTCAHGLGL